MLLFLFATILILGIIFLILYARPEYYNKAFEILGSLFAVIGTITVTVSLIIFLFSYIPAQATLDVLEIERASLVYQYENDFYNNDNDIGKKELMAEIQNFNENLTLHKRLQRDIWVGIYYANIYDDLELIDILSRS